MMLEDMFEKGKEMLHSEVLLLKQAGVNLNPVPKLYLGKVKKS